MSLYKDLVIKAIKELKEPRKGSSLISIKNHVQASMTKGKEYNNGTYLLALKQAVGTGELIQTKGSYKVSSEFKKAALKKSKPAPKNVAKKVTAKKTVKKTVSKKKPISKKTATKKAAPKKTKATKKTTLKNNAPAKKAASKKKVISTKSATKKNTPKKQ